MSCVPKVFAYGRRGEVVSRPYMLCGNWTKAFGVLIGMRQIFFVNFLSCLSNKLILKMENGATWMEYVI